MFQCNMNTTLGIDIGTTSVKACVVKNGEILDAVKCHHNAKTSAMDNSHPSSYLFDEQNPLLILKALDDCLTKLSCSEVSNIRICGQMHGVLLWQPLSVVKDTATDFECLFESTVADISNLVTWQDRRCDKDFLNSLPCSPSFCNISTGYGIATLLWLLENEKLGNFSMCGTIMDFIVWLLTHTEYVKITSHNAKSWGYFDMTKGCWEVEEIRALENLLPNVVPVDFPAGRLTNPLHGMETALVYPALGDMQCSIHSSKPKCNETVLNIGTSSQLSFVLKHDIRVIDDICLKCPAVECVPYKNGRVLITAASLTGGNVLDLFASNIQSWLHDLECNTVLNKQDIFEKLENLAKKHAANHDASKPLVIDPRIFGERHSPDSLASVLNISPNNCSLGAITSALYKGIIQNMSTMLPVNLLKQHGVEAIVATGSILTENDMLQNIVRDVFLMPLRASKHGDAAFGAAIFATHE